LAVICVNRTTRFHLYSLFPVIPTQPDTKLHPMPDFWLMLWKLTHTARQHWLPAVLCGDSGCAISCLMLAVGFKRSTTLGGTKSIVKLSLTG
jgi:hypothetical protein